MSANGCDVDCDMIGNGPNTTARMQTFGEDVLAGVPAIYEAWVTWLRETPEDEWRTKPMPDAIAEAAIDAMYALGDADERHASLLRVFRAVDHEWTKGLRCGVCAHADDPTYDHTNNC